MMDFIFTTQSETPKVEEALPSTTLTDKTDTRVLPNHSPNRRRISPLDTVVNEGLGSLDFKQIEQTWMTLEERIREEREITRQLKQKQSQLEPLFMQHLGRQPGATLESDHFKVMIQNKKKKSKMNGDHIMKCLSSYLAHYSMIPNDHRKFAFEEMSSEFDRVRKERSEITTPNPMLETQAHEVARQRKDMYTLLAMDIVRYMESARSEELVPVLSRRSLKKRRLE